MADKPKLPSVPIAPSKLAAEKSVKERLAEIQKQKQLGSGSSSLADRPASSSPSIASSMKEKFAKAAGQGQLVYLCIVLDTTGSSHPYIKDMRSKAAELVKDSAELYGNRLWIGIVEYKDWANHQSKEGPFVLRVTDFTQDFNKVRRHISDMKDGPSNWDSDECMECALSVVNSLGWPDGHAANKLVALMCDAPPHAVSRCKSKCQSFNDRVTYFEESDGPQPCNVASGIDYRREVERLAARGIKVFGLLCSTESRVDFSKLDELALGTQGDFAEFEQIEKILAWMSAKTGGIAASVADPATAMDAIRTSMAASTGVAVADIKNRLAAANPSGLLTDAQEKIVNRLLEGPKKPTKK